MHLLTTAFLVLVVWTALAIPAAVVVGRFLHAGNGVKAEGSGSAGTDSRAA